MNIGKHGKKAKGHIIMLALGSGSRMNTGDVDVPKCLLSTPSLPSPLEVFARAAEECDMVFHVCVPVGRQADMARRQASASRYEINVTHAKPSGIQTLDAIGALGILANSTPMYGERVIFVWSDLTAYDAIELAGAIKRVDAQPFRRHIACVSHDMPCSYALRVKGADTVAVKNEKGGPCDNGLVGIYSFGDAENTIAELTAAFERGCHEMHQVSAEWWPVQVSCLVEFRDRATYDTLVRGGLETARLAGCGTGKGDAKLSFDDDVVTKTATTPYGAKCLADEMEWYAKSRWPNRAASKAVDDAIVTHRIDGVTVSDAIRRLKTGGKIGRFENAAGLVAAYVEDVARQHERSGFSEAPRADGKYMPGTLSRAVWNEFVRRPMERADFASPMLTRYFSTELSRLLHVAWKTVIEPWADTVECVTHIHGDVTCDNAILRGDVFTYIDPRGSFGGLRSPYGPADADFAKIAYSLETHMELTSTAVYGDKALFAEPAIPMEEWPERLKKPHVLVMSAINAIAFAGCLVRDPLRARMAYEAGIAKLAARVTMG